MMTTVSADSGCISAANDSERMPDAPASYGDVLDVYNESVFLFASPSTTLLARGCTADLADDGAYTGGYDPRAITRMFELARSNGVSDPVLVGAVPFDSSQAARLTIAAHAARLGSLDRNEALPDDKVSSGMRADETYSYGLGADHVVPTPEPSVAIYEAAVNDALARFERGELSKVVLSRTLVLALSQPLALRRLIARLLEKNVHGYTYAVPLSNAAGVFLGATPELLVRREGRRVILNPLAGSAARRHDPLEDKAVAQTLLNSDKDVHEHKIVIDAIATALRPLCATLTVPDAPSLSQTDALWHLSTTIEGELIDPTTTSLDLAFALHPTPAVCGYPNDAAFNAITELEPFDRGLFAGFVGWMDAHGDGEWAVSLRCALCTPTRVTLYAGAGIVPGSVPTSETAETQTKLRTMLSALGLDQAIART